MLNLESIRDAIPFPKTQTGYDPMSDSPSYLEEEILAEYSIKYNEEDNEI